MFSTTTIMDYIFTIPQTNGCRVALRQSEIISMEEAQKTYDVTKFSPPPQGTGTIIMVRGGRAYYSTMSFDDLYKLFYSEKKKS